MKAVILGDREGFLRAQSGDSLKGLELVGLNSGHASAAEIISAAADAQVLIAEPNNTLDATLIEKLPNLRLIHGVGVGYDKFDLNAAKKLGIYVCNCRGANSVAVAEHAVMFMLALLRHVFEYDDAVRAGEQDKQQKVCIFTGCIKELCDCTVGLVGFGNIAQNVARMLKPFGARVLYYDAYPIPESVARECSAQPVSMDELLAESDIVSLHTAATNETRGMVNENFLDKMKPGAYLINTARGDLVNNEALLKALVSGRLAGAGLDTVAPEPVTADNPLLQLPDEVKRKVIFSPHIAGITGAAAKRNYHIIGKAIEAIAAGQRPANIVNGL